jgi:hypothetical protein
MMNLVKSLHNGDPDVIQTRGLPSSVADPDRYPKPADPNPIKLN